MSIIPMMVFFGFLLFMCFVALGSYLEERVIPSEEFTRTQKVYSTAYLSYNELESKINDGWVLIGMSNDMLPKHKAWVILEKLGVEGDD